jgi:hypothetical protein
MSRKHYRLIAETIERELPIEAHRAQHSDQYNTLYSVADALSVIFKQDNPNFRRSTFMDACGFPGFA